MSAGFLIRDATDVDMDGCRRIYEPEVLEGFASFELIAPDEAEMARRRQAVVALGLPWLVAIDRDGVLLGYAYAGSYRARPAYRWTVEDSVYVRRDAQGRGVGSALLAALVERCEDGPWRQMIAVIGDSRNEGSISLHRRLGFVHVGTLENVGFKLGRWLDTVLMQRPLSAGAGCAPD